MPRYSVFVEATQTFEVAVVLDAPSREEACYRAEEFAARHARRMEWDERGDIEVDGHVDCQEVDEDEEITAVHGYRP